jgi:cobyrinic acid a,c-diamide synthase
MVLPERHLGLTVANEVSDALQRLDAAADALANTPLGQMTLGDLQRWTVNFAATEAMPPRFLPLQSKTIAIARDAAFCFIYAANLDCLRALGAELVFFSPLADAAVPPCDALWLPGGYPELHAQRLSSNMSMRESLAAHVAQHKPVWAECGGMMLLFDTLVTVDGQSHAQMGLLPGTVTLQKRLAGLGPQQLVLPEGTLRGHTFHYSTCVTTLPAAYRTSRSHQEPSPDAGEAVYQLGSIRASYFHAWFASSPRATAALFMPTQQADSA